MILTGPADVSSHQDDYNNGANQKTTNVLDAKISHFVNYSEDTKRTWFESLTRFLKAKVLQVQGCYVAPLEKGYE